MNYRITTSDEEARRLIRAGKLEKLQQYDQLTNEMAAGRVFQVGWRGGWGWGWRSVHRLQPANHTRGCLWWYEGEVGIARPAH